MMRSTFGGSWKKNITSASVASSLSESLAGFFVAVSFARTVPAFLLVLMGNGFEWIYMIEKTHTRAHFINLSGAW